MAGFVDVSALLRRKTFKLDLSSGKGAEEKNLEPQDEAKAFDTPVDSRPLSEQQPNGKAPPKSPRSTLQADSSGGTTPTTPLLQTLVGLAEENHLNGTAREKDEAVTMDEPAFEVELKEVAGQSLPVPIVAGEEGVQLVANGRQDLVAERILNTEAEPGVSGREDLAAVAKLQNLKESQPVLEEPADRKIAESVDRGVTEAVPGDFAANAADVTRENAVVTKEGPTAHITEAERSELAGDEMPRDILQGHADPPTEMKHVIVVQQGADGKNGVKECDSDAQALVDDTGGPAVARQWGSGRFSKVGGLFKRTLSFTKSKGEAGGAELPGEDDTPPAEVPGKESKGGDFKESRANEDISRADDDIGTGQPANLNSPVNGIEAPAPQVARADSGRFRSLLKKLIPGGAAAGETGLPGGAVAGETVPPLREGADGGVPVLETFALPRSISVGSGEHNAGVDVGTPAPHSAGINSGAPPGVSGRVGALLQKLTFKQTEGEEWVGRGDAPQTVTAEDRSSAFRIPKYLLPGGKETGEGRLELEGVETPLASPLIAFVDGQVGEGDWRRELSSILGAGQVYDTAHLSVAGFLASLLPKLSELSRRGDMVAAAVKDNLRILVVGEEALFKSVSSALQESTAGKNIPVGCVPVGGRSSLAQALGLSQIATEASWQSVLDLLVQMADAGTQLMDCWEVKLTTHRKRSASNLPASLKSIPVEGGKSDWVVAHQGLCWGSLHLDMGYMHSVNAGGTAKVPPRKPAAWLCGACSREPLVIRSQNVGRLEIIQNGVWSYLELSPQIRSLEFLNLADARRKMKTLEKNTADSYADDGRIEIVGIQEGSDTEICLAQTNAVRLELFGNAEVDHVKLRLDSESWVQPLAGEATTDPAVIQITHAGQVPVLVTPTASLKCTTPAVFRPPVFAPPPLESPLEKPPGFFRRSASPFRKGGRFRSASPFRKGSRSRRRSPSPGPRSPQEARETAQDPSESVQTAREDGRTVRAGVKTSSNGVRLASETGPGARVDPASNASETVRTSEAVSNALRAAAQPRPAPNERVFGPTARRRAQSPVPGGRVEREVRGGGEPQRANASPGKGYAEAATAAAVRGGAGVGSRRAGLSLPWTLKVEKLVDTDKPVQPQQRLARTPSGSGNGRQEVYEPVAKTLVRTGSGRLTGDEFSRPPSPSLYRSSSRDNLDQAALSRPASPSPAFYRSSSRDNLELAGAYSRPASPGLSRQNSGNTGYSPRVNVLHPPRSESPVHLREPTPERLPRMADWATGMSRRGASLTYNGGVHSHLLTKQEREQAVAIGYGGTLSREERERMQVLAFGGASSSDRGATPQRIRSARARYIGAAAAMYNTQGPLELDLATDDKTESPPPPVRTARDYFSGPLTPTGMPAIRRSQG